MVPNGDSATFIVEAEGDGLTYQWLCRAPGASSFEYLTGSDATSSTLRVEMTAESNGAEYRCFITNSAGEMASTRIATVKLDILDWTMEYNTSGQRTKRISDEKTYTYIYADDKLMRMTVGDDVLDFSYDTNGAPLTMTYNGTVYYYITNLQGDVRSLQSANGVTGAQYAYDAWGNIIAMQGDLAELNPLRYRGYVYDQETGFYYLNSRYYDPEIGRFINADGYASTGQGILGHNMFAYCVNNPIRHVDSAGVSPVDLLTIGDYYVIHKMIQADCVLKYMWDMEVYVSGPQGKGFLDLYDYRNNQYYEIKSKHAGGLPSTERQMQKYDVAKIKAKRYTNPPLESPSRGFQFVTGKLTYGLWDVEYKWERPGLITYETKFNWQRAGIYAAIVLSIGLGIVTEGTSVPITAPLFGLV